jgi:Zn-dependent metalloprotease
MANRDETLRKLKQELDKQQKLRHDEKAWKAQHKNVEKAHDAYRETFRRNR